MRRLAIDFGTSNTVAALAVDGQAPRTVTFGPSSLLPSAVYAGPDGITVGREAQRQARLDPSCFEPNPKRRVDDGDVLLGDRVYPVVELVAAVLRTVAGEVQRQFGGQAVDEVRLTHPAQWGSTRQNTLLAAARMAGLGRSVQLIPEPVAAAAQFTQLPGRELAEGRAVAIYDLGGGTFDVAVVGRTSGGFSVLAEAGLTDLGGLDFDQAILDLVGRSASAQDGARWQAIVRPVDGGTRRAARTLAEDVRAAKETLSDYSQTEVALPDPFSDVHLTRTEFEGLVRPNLMRSIEVLDQTLRGAGVSPAALGGIFLVGGSSRIPLVARLIQERFNVIPVALDQPETAVALGALVVPGPASVGRQTPPSGPAAVGATGPTGQRPAPPSWQQTGPGQRAVPPSGPQFAGQPTAYIPPAWAGVEPVAATRRSGRLLVLAAVAAVVVVVVAALLIARPFASSTNTATSTPVVPPAGSTAGTATSPGGARSTAPSSQFRSSALKSGLGPVSAPSTGPSSTGQSSTGQSSTVPGDTPGSLTSSESTFLGSGFVVKDCVLPEKVTGSDSAGPVVILREILCELNTGISGGTVYVFVVSLASEQDVGSYLEYLVSSRAAVTGSVPDENTTYARNGISGRVISAEKLPIAGTEHPCVAWTATGENFVGVIAGTGSVTISDLAGYWNDKVAS